MAEKIKLAINGAAGRMGQRIFALAREDERFEVACMIEAGGHPYAGKEVGGVKYRDGLTGDADVVIDFSLPKGTESIVAAAMNRNVAMVIGTTGLSGPQQGAIDEAAKHIAIIQAANMSMGVNLLLKLVAEAAAVLGDAYDIEIVESHHRFKKDAPSGTALALARSICQATGKNFETSLKHGRRGEDPRQDGEIGMHAVRMGDVAGVHTVSFGAIGETITLGHNAHTRDTFALGALRAAAWVKGRPAGKYSMTDVLFGK